jgi:hypothetical protein
MTAATIRKAHRLPVVRALDGTYRVGGYTGVYQVWRSALTNAWACDCAARTDRCSHVLAVEFASERKGAT